MMDDIFARGVLVVDDERLVLKYITSILPGLGYQRVFGAQNAQEARAFLAAEKLSLVICDVSLPDGDGRQILREALEKDAHVACVLMTGFATADLKLPDDLREKILFLEKPFTAEEMSQILTKIPGLR